MRGDGRRARRKVVGLKGEKEGPREGVSNNGRLIEGEGGLGERKGGKATGEKGRRGGRGEKGKGGGLRKERGAGWRIGIVNKDLLSV